MSNLSRALSTPEGRSTFQTFAEESVRTRIRKRWERRREETSEPHRVRTMSAKGLPVPIITARGLRQAREAIGGDGVPPEPTGESISSRRFQTEAIRTQIYLCR